MLEQFSRAERLLGCESIEKLGHSRVAVFGIGGVGGYVVEALARTGVGAIDIIDNDTVCASNLNRQIIATHNTIDCYKVDVMEERILDINPGVTVRKYKSFFLPENAHEFPFAEYDYIVDAIDTITGKIELVLQAEKAGVPIISSMGTGNKLDPVKLQVADIYETKVCPLAKVMRKELKIRNVKKLKVVYSREEVIKPLEDLETEHNSDNKRRAIPGSVAFVPSVAGLIIAGEVIKDMVRC